MAIFYAITICLHTHIIYLLLLFAVNVGEDCPVFDGLYEFCQLAIGGSVGKSSSHTLIEHIRPVHKFDIDCSNLLLVFVRIFQGRIVIGLVQETVNKQNVILYCYL